jgi:hypothetical protein
MKKTIVNQDSLVGEITSTAEDVQSLNAVSSGTGNQVPDLAPDELFQNINDTWVQVRTSENAVGVPTSSDQSFIMI